MRHASTKRSIYATLDRHLYRETLAVGVFHCNLKNAPVPAVMNTNYNYDFSKFSFTRLVSNAHKFRTFEKPDKNSIF